MKLTRFIYIIILFIINLAPAFSQLSSVKGQLVDSKSNAPIINSTVKFVNESDTTQIYYSVSQLDGTFAISNVKIANYKIEATSIGYEKKIIKKNIDKANFDLGIIKMSDKPISVDEMIVEGKTVIAVQKGDTTEFKSSFFKTNKDATAEELITKLPGLQVESGTVKSGGEQVQRVLVNGRQFFGNDPMIALRNLPAEVIDRIQVFDKQSDQSALTGFNDGNTTKTLNIVTRPDRKNLQFGKFSAGYGESELYSLNGSMNKFEDGQQFSVIGMSNNVNQQNFAMQDLLGIMGGGGSGGRGGMMFGGGRGGMMFGGGSGGMMFGGGSGGQGGNFNPGNYMVGQQSGLNTTNSLGLNYSNKWQNGIDLQSSYFLNISKNNNPQNLNREYFVTQDSSFYYNENRESDSENFNHRLNSRFTFVADSNNTLIISPTINFQNNNSDYITSAKNYNGNINFNSLNSNNSSNSKGYNISNNIIYRHKFDKQGRTFSFDFGSSLNNSTRNSDINSITVYPARSRLNDSLDQKGNSLTDGYSINSRIQFTEQLTENSILQLNYSPSYSKNIQEDFNNSFNKITDSYSLLDSNLSGNFDNRVTQQRAGLGYRFNLPGININAELSYQTSLHNNFQKLPFVKEFNRSYYALLPNMNMSYDVSQDTRLNINYRTSSNAPSVTQLLESVDNTNPLQLRTGNPNLKEAFNHNLVARYSKTNFAAAQTFFVIFIANYSNNYIGNANYISSGDSFFVGSVKLNRGSQLSMPVNLDGYWSTRGFFTFGMPITSLSSTININTGLSYTSTPTLINGNKNLSKSLTLNQGLVFASNISQEFDFTLSYFGNFGLVQTSIQNNIDNNSFNHLASFRLNWTFWEGIVVRTEIANTFNKGLASGYNQSYTAMNLSFGKKFLEKENGELRVSLNNILNQSNSINRTVTDTYIEDSQSNVLGRYAMLNFTYTIR